MTIITLLVVVIAYLIWDPDFSSQSRDANRTAAERPLDVTTRNTVQNNSIAVLKFSSLSPDPADAYFADGMAAEIQSVLARIPDLRTVAISASQRLRGIELDEQALGERLGVSYLLDGSVRKAGDDIRITVQLIRADDGQQVWSETYQRKVDDVFDLENRTRTGYVSPTAMFYAALGLADRDRIFFWLDQAINEKVFLVIVLLRTSPLVNSIRNDPRFEAALDRVGLLRDI